MTIRELARGPNDFIVQCRYCGTKFKYELKDVGRIDLSYSRWVECPRCNHPVEHDAIANDGRTLDH